VYDYIIATDEGGSGQDVEEDSGTESLQLEEENSQRDSDADNVPGSSRRKRKRAPTPPVKTSRHKKRRGVKSDKEYGVARGIDFLDVACVLNFDLPTSARAYTHRVGRTARAGRGGTALSFVLPSSEFGKHKATGSVSSTRHDEETWDRIARTQQGRVREYVFDKRQVDGFRYRMEDALRAVTRYAIREARLKEIKQELITSDKLKAHFEDNPNDLEFLKHDKPLHPTRVQPHMKHVPKYLMPNVTAASTPAASKEKGEGAAFVPFSNGKIRGHGRGRGGKFGGGGGRGGKKKNDPLKKFR